METIFQKISRKTGMKQSDCKCQKCKSQCLQPCIGTPEDIFKIIGAGYQNRVALTHWLAGMSIGVCDRPVQIIAPLYDKEKKSCTFFTNGLCELHDKGLKPTEGKLSHHSISATNFIPKKSISWAVAKEWLNVSEKEIQALIDKHVNPVTV